MDLVISFSSRASQVILDCCHPKNVQEQVIDASCCFHIESSLLFTLGMYTSQIERNLGLGLHHATGSDIQNAVQSLLVLQI